MRAMIRLKFAGFQHDHPASCTVSWGLRRRPGTEPSIERLLEADELLFEAQSAIGRARLGITSQRRNPEPASANDPGSPLAFCEHGFAYALSSPGGRNGEIADIGIGEGHLVDLVDINAGQNGRISDND